jgi:hypothetical protein
VPYPQRTSSFVPFRIPPSQPQLVWFVKQNTGEFFASAQERGMADETTDRLGQAAGPSCHAQAN